MSLSIFIFNKEVLTVKGKKKLRSSDILEFTHIVTNAHADKLPTNVWMKKKTIFRFILD